jgi:hypothetical protein
MTMGRQFYTIGYRARRPARATGARSRTIDASFFRIVCKMTQMICLPGAPTLVCPEDAEDCLAIRTISGSFPNENRPHLADFAFCFVCVFAQLSASGQRRLDKTRRFWKKSPVGKLTHLVKKG